MYNGDFCPVGDVAFRCKPRELFESAKRMREHARVLEQEQGDTGTEYLYACALWYEDLACLISEIALLPEVLAKSSY